MADSYHWMHFESISPDADVLRCPVCGRRIRIQWEPEFKKTVLDEGDAYAVHSASKRDDARRLAAWDEMLDSMGFGKLWEG